MNKTYFNCIFIALFIMSFCMCNNLSSDEGFSFNVNIAWSARIDSDYEIFYFDGKDVTQITHNNYDDLVVKISGSNIAWTGFCEGKEYYDLFFYDGESITQLTDSGIGVNYFSIYGNNVVWSENVGNDDEIFFFNGNSTTQLTDNIFSDELPQIHGSNIVWYGYDGNDYEIFFFDGNSTKQITNNNIHDWCGNIYSNTFVWWGEYSTGSAIHYYDGNKAHMLTDSVYFRENLYIPQIYGNTIIWYGYVGSKDKQGIFIYNGDTAYQIVEDSINCPPVLSDNKIAYSANNEIYFYDSISSKRLTKNTYYEYQLGISANYVVWLGETGNHYEVFLYDGSNVHQITDNDYNVWYLDISRE